MWEKWVSFGVNATIPILWGSEPGGGGRQADLGSARGTIASGSSAVNCAATQVCTEGPRRATVRVGQESQGDVESAGTSCWQAGKKGQQLKLHYTVGGRIPAKKE
eukprot:GGOE01029413.1.p3 GENE.GGOE01029413.1~~GGOE01029413.1.p3  ORF type:complete len:105 (+),score=9.88 GGOE01029413.1:342-656(+)